jgi:hypothetical protein
LAESEISLRRQVREYKRLTFADSIRSAYSCQMKKYLNFCELYGWQPVPANTDMLCMYAVYLSHTLCPSSIKQYLNVIRILHLQNDLENPLQDNFHLAAVLKGISRHKGQIVHQKLPITIGILSSFVKVLNLQNSQDLTFWAACLVAFYGMLRKSSMFPEKQVSGHMCISNCAMYSWGLKIDFNYSKTIQCKERRAYIVLPWNREKPDLCPVSTLLRSLQSSGCRQAADNLFTFVSGGRKYQMSHSMFDYMLKRVLKAIGLSSEHYSGHSFRRGGATHALYAGIPAEVIRAQGDWKSLAYLRYLDTRDSAGRAEFIENMYLV